MIFDALKSKWWNVLATNIPIFNTFYSTRLISKSEHLLLFWFFLSRFGFNHLEISKCPNIGELFQLTRTPEVSVRLRNSCTVYIIYFWTPCSMVGKRCNAGYHVTRQTELAVEGHSCRTDLLHAWIWDYYTVLNTLDVMYLI